MFERTDIVYIYDGSYEGLLCCIYETFERKELPMDIIAEDCLQLMMYDSRRISTDDSRAENVERVIREWVGEGYFLIETGYYSANPNKERMICDYAYLCSMHRKKILSMLANDTVHALRKAASVVSTEALHYLQFIRFSASNSALTATISPESFILPLIAGHFCERYLNETFIIYDDTHGAALIYQNYKHAIIPVEEYSPPPVSSEELAYRKLWKLFYDTVAIQERFNPKCRRNFMPKKYWKHLTELNPLLTSIEAVDGKAGIGSALIGE